MTNDVHRAHVTKRTWDRLLLPIAGTTGVVAVMLGLLADFWDALTLPGFAVACWIYFRWSTPAAGRKAVSISGNPKIQALLSWQIFVLALAAMWQFIATIILGRPFHTPLSGFEIVAFVALFCLLMGGVWVIERRVPQRTSPSKGGEPPTAT